MLLAVDVGNTHTVVGVYDGADLRKSWRVSSDRSWTSTQVMIQLDQLLKLDGDVAGQIGESIISSVVPSLSHAWQKAICAVVGNPAHNVSAANDYGMKVDYPNPREIGPDRIADAIAAVEKYGAPTIVVDLGTATNIEVINKTGSFVGGVIAPGIQVSADALFSSAARLAQVDLRAPLHVVGKNTIEAVQSGLTYGEVARIDGLVAMIKRELGYDAKVVATGGLHSMIAPISSTIDYRDPNLTLDGLRIINDRL